MTIEKKQETNGITISCFFVWQFMVHSMICMSGQPGYSLLTYYLLNYVITVDSITFMDFICIKSESSALHKIVFDVHYQFSCTTNSKRKEKKSFARNLYFYFSSPIQSSIPSRCYSNLISSAITLSEAGSLLKYAFFALEANLNVFNFGAPKYENVYCLEQ